MKQGFFASLALLLFAINSSVAVQAAEAGTLGEMPREQWRWPLDDYGRDSIRQDYAEYDACVKNCDHRSGAHRAGIDVNAPKGTPVKVIASGFVVNLVPNDRGCTSDCADHGDGNTIIIQHGDKFFSQYQHLLNFNDNDPLIGQIKQRCAFYDRSDENGVRISGWECTKEDGVDVDEGDVVGYVGGTGAGRAHKWPDYLHFEVKRFATLYSFDCYRDSECCPRHKCFEYTGIHPFQVGYNDPLNGIEHTLGQIHIRVKVGPQGEGVGLRLGPNEVYDLQTRWHSSDGDYWVARVAPNGTENCDQGWYKLMKVRYFPPPKDMYFDPTDAGRPGPGELPDTWVCIGNGSDQYVVEDP